MESIYRIVNTIKDDTLSQKDIYSLQFLEYVKVKDKEEPIEIVKNKVNLVTGQIFTDALNMGEGKNADRFLITDDTEFEFISYINFIKDICNGLSREAMNFCFDLYSEFYNTGKSKDAYVPTMSVNLELDCSKDGYLVEYYYFQDFENLLVYDFYAAIKEKKAIKKCGICGTYFITEKRNDQLYCSQYCKSVASREHSRRYYTPSDKSEMLKRRIASRLQQRTKIKNEQKKKQRILEHKEFLEQAKLWKRQIKAGKAKSNDYHLWLLQMDMRYKK